MCGISGIVTKDTHQDIRPDIERMTRRLAHRGPDAQGIFIEPGIALGHRRLSIIDLSDDSRQPMNDARGRYTMVYNGEIYNFREVKARLKDYPFRTNSDSEVLLAAYSQWGADCLEYLDGMFAFAIWDRHNRELFVARDRLGVKPFYYVEREGFFLFASELRSLIASGLIPVQLDRSSICDYMMYQSVAAPATVLEGVRQLMPGECGIYKDQLFTRRYYWNIGEAGTETGQSDARTVHRQVRRLLTESVEKRMISDVPLGVFLSGGIDSSAIVGLMAECTEQAVNTFSITFREPEFDESEYSSLVARRFNTCHHPILLRPDDFLECLPDALQATDNPSGDGFNTYLVSRKTKEAGITVALSGIGGDELFAGYQGFTRWMKIRRHVWWKLPLVMRRQVTSLLDAASSRSKWRRLAGILSAENPDISSLYPFFRQVMAAKSASQLLARDNAHQEFRTTNLTSQQAIVDRLPLLSRYSVAELQGYTSNVLLKDTDQMSMASALEVREPFFDHHLIEYVLQIPDALKYPRYPKSLLVESLAPLLPEGIVHRPKKGFTLPWNQWLKHELKGWCLQNLDSLAQRPCFDEQAVRKLGAEFFQRKNSNKWMSIFQLAVLEDWIARNIP